MKILVTGANGLVGSAIRRVADEFPQYKFFFATREHADLTKENDVRDLYMIHSPDYVINCAAEVGGIGKNTSSPAELFRKNILMNTHMLHYACKSEVKKYLAFSSVCVFPFEEKVVSEKMMLEGHPYPANEAYGWSKRMVDVMITAYKKQYNIKNYSSVIPGNIFGPNDLYNLRDAHVLPALIHKIFLAKKNKEPLKVWGDGSSAREFIYSIDLARIILKIIGLDEIPQRIIISGEKQYTIREIVEKLCAAADFKNGIVWETDKPNGQGPRSSDLSLLKSLVEVSYTDLDLALKESYEFFAENYPKVRL